jgi:replicative DNA helicase
MWGQNQAAMNFQTILQQMEQQVRQEEYVFAPDPENNKQIKVVNPTGLYNRELNPIESEMLRKIESVDNYSWRRGKTGGPTTGFPLFDEAIEGGIQPGLIVFAASPNVGKSAFMMQTMKQISEKNEKVFCEYHSFDDSSNEILPRWIACDQHITIAQAKNPERFEDQPDIIEKRNEGLKNIYRNIHRFSLRDANDAGTSVEKMEERIKTLKMFLPEDTRIIIGIDSFYDLTTEKKNLQDKALWDYLAQTVKSWVDSYDITVMVTAHLRKLNGNRRPTNDDLKETNRLEYEANLICLLYNEVGIKEEGADVYWLHEDEETKMPVLEVKFSKNKFGSFKGTRFYEFIPKQSFFIEASLEACKRYSSLIHQR